MSATCSASLLIQRVTGVQKDEPSLACDVASNEKIAFTSVCEREKDRCCMRNDRTACISDYNFRIEGGRSINLELMGVENEPAGGSPIGSPRSRIPSPLSAASSSHFLPALSSLVLLESSLEHVHIYLIMNTLEA